MTNMLWHILTCEYPPDAGGVADYTESVAQGLASRGHEVHVWCAVRKGNRTEGWGTEDGRTAEGRMGEGGAGDGGRDFDNDGATQRIEVHWIGPGFGRRFREQMSAKLSTFSGPHRILVQYTPHGFGWKAMNLPLCWWLWQRKRRHGDDIWVMFHEVAFPIVFWPIKHLPLGLVNRVMVAMVLRAASRVFMSIPGWEPVLRSLAPQGQKFEWLPVPSNIALQINEQRVRQIRGSIAGSDSNSNWIVGHFGTYGELITRFLTPALLELLKHDRRILIRLIGRNSDRYALKLWAQFPEVSDRITATGAISSESAAEQIAACDLMLQPYADGVSTRRTSIMASLALGVPAVSTTGPLTEPLWAESHVLTLSSPGDTQALVDNAIALLRDEPKRCAKGIHSRHFYEDRFSLRSLLDRLES